MEEKEFDYLNVIPLVDVMLVLLTIVLTTSTFIATGGIKVELPKTSTSELASTLHPRTVVISKEGSIWLDSEEATLASLIVSMKDTARETPILVRADKSLALQTFVDVFGAIKQLGFTSLSLQTELSP